MVEEKSIITEDESINDVAEIVKPSSVSDLEPKMQLTGTVKRLELYGAFVDIGVGTNAILHISKLENRVNRISDILSVGDEIQVYVDGIDKQREQITVTMVEPLAVDWNDLKEGQIYSGTVTRVEKFGAFVNIGAEKEGLIHVSELSNEYIKHPSETVRIGDEFQVKVLGFNKRKRRIDLSRKALLESPEEEEAQVDEELEEQEEIVPTAMEIALRRAMDQTNSGEATEVGAGSSAEKSEKQLRKEQDDILSRTLQLGQESST